MPTNSSPAEEGIKHVRSKMPVLKPVVLEIRQSTEQMLRYTSALCNILHICVRFLALKESAHFDKIVLELDIAQARIEDYSLRFKKLFEKVKKHNKEI